MRLSPRDPSNARVKVKTRGQTQKKAFTFDMNWKAIMTLALLLVTPRM